MSRAKRPASCHPDRDHYAKGLCKSCYVQLVRNPETTRKNNAKREERHREERNRIRAERAKAKYQPKRDKLSAPESN